MTAMLGRKGLHANVIESDDGTSLGYIQCDVGSLYQRYVALWQR